MSQATMSLESDGTNIELSASLLITATATSSSSKYSKKWRKSLYIGRFIISLKKPTTSSANYEEIESLPPSPLSSVYTSLPPSPPARTSSAKSYVGIDITSHAQEGDIAEIVKKKDLKSLLDFGGVDRVREVLGGQTHHSSKVS